MKPMIKLFLSGMLILFLVAHLFGQALDSPKPKSKTFFISPVLSFLQLYYYQPDTGGNEKPEARLAFPGGMGGALNYVISPSYNVVLNIPLILNVDRTFSAFNISAGLALSFIQGKQAFGVGIATDIIRKQENGYEIGLYSKKHRQSNVSVLFQFGFAIPYESWVDRKEEELAKVEKLELKDLKDLKDLKEAKNSLIKAFKFGIQENKEKENFAAICLFEEKLKELIKKPAEDSVIKESKEFLQTGGHGEK